MKLLKRVGSFWKIWMGAAALIALTGCADGYYGVAASPGWPAYGGYYGPEDYYGGYYGPDFYTYYGPSFYFGDNDWHHGFRGFDRDRFHEYGGRFSARGFRGGEGFHGGGAHARGGFGGYHGSGGYHGGGHG